MEDPIEFRHDRLAFALTAELGWIQVWNLEWYEHLPDLVIDRIDDPQVLIFRLPSAYLTKKDMERAKDLLADHAFRHSTNEEMEVILLCGDQLIPPPALPKNFIMMTVFSSMEGAELKTVNVN